MTNTETISYAEECLNTSHSEKEADFYETVINKLKTINALEDLLSVSYEMKKKPAKFQARGFSSQEEYEAYWGFN